MNYTAGQKEQAQKQEENRSILEMHATNVKFVL